MMVFITDTGIEVPAVTSDQMREVDRIATEETGPNLFQMMENAGHSLACFVLEKLGDRWRQASVVVLAGPGGNGGGGICAARHLANRGVVMKVCLSHPDMLSKVTNFQRKIFHSTPGCEVQLIDLDKIRPSLIVDALIGYSLSEAPRDLVLDLIRWANGAGSRILSLDVPSGLDATTGETPGEVIRPNWTLTLALPKTGLLPDRTGELHLADLGIPSQVYEKVGLLYQPPFDHRYIVPLYWVD